MPRPVMRSLRSKSRVRSTDNAILDLKLNNEYYLYLIIVETRAIIEAPNWKVDGKILWADNCDFYSQDLFSTDNVNRDDCRKMCFDNPQCSHFTWYIEDGPTGKYTFVFRRKEIGLEINRML